MSYVTTSDGTQIFWRSIGQGRPVVLIHGWPLSSATYADIGYDLATAGFKVITYDRRGFGQSDHPWHGYDYDTFANDLHAVITNLSLTDFSLVGFSMGGGEVARYCSTHGRTAVRSACLVGAVTPCLMTNSEFDGLDPQIFEGIKGAIRKDRLGFFKELAANFYADASDQKVSQEQLDFFQAQARVASPKAVLDCVDAFSRTDFTNELRLIPKPMLFIHGDADKMVPIELTAHRAIKLVKNGRLEVVPGAGHGILDTHREKISKLLLDWLN